MLRFQHLPLPKSRIGVVAVVFEDETSALPDRFIDFATERVIAATQRVDRSQEVDRLRNVPDSPEKMFAGGEFCGGRSCPKQPKRDEKERETTAEAEHSHFIAAWKNTSEKLNQKPKMSAANRTVPASGCGAVNFAREL
jgi:hypothetical protein